MSKHRRSSRSDRVSSQSSRGVRAGSVVLVTCALTIAVLTAGTGAQPSPPTIGAEGSPNVDIRLKESLSEDQLAYLARLSPALSSTAAATIQARIAGVARLEAADGALAVEAHPSLGAPEVVSAMPGGAFLTPPSTDRVAALRAFLTSYADAYGVTAPQVQSLDVVADYVNPAGNMAWVELGQSFNDIPVFQGVIRGGFTAKGELARTTGTLASIVDAKALASTPMLSERQAIAMAAASVGWNVDEGTLVSKGDDDAGHAIFGSANLADDARAWLVYFPLSTGVVRLAWATEVWGDPMAYFVLLDAEDGTLLFRKNMTNFQTQTATYVIYNDDSPAPLSPSTALPGANTQAPVIARTAQTLIGNEAPNTFNSLGWIADGLNITDGNNVEAGLDIDGIDGVDAPVPGAARVFNFAYNPAPGNPAPGDAPNVAAYRNGEVTNMFFWSNVFHDRLYLLGFTELARNFQHNNFARGGAQADRVRAEAQDSISVNNANFLTPPDGGRGRMQMFVFPNTDPDRTSGLDNEVLLHELTHGLSNRLHSNAAGLGTTLAAGLGEGWSDFYARALLSSAAEDVNGIYSTGGWVTHLINPGYTDNYYYGIRRFPYAVKTNLGANGKPHNPLTFADIDPAQISLTDGAFPRGPIGSATATEVHNTGEVWCMALLEVRARFITRLGFAAGNQRILQFVTDGMKLDPRDPTFLQARDSILAAANAGGASAADIADIWAGFAARGMGVFATHNFGDSVTESFLTPSDARPTFSIDDVNVVEGDSGTTTATFTVTLSNPLNTTHRVSYATDNGTAASPIATVTSGALTVPSASALPASDGPASPYPATFGVAGLGGSIVNVSLRLNGLSHSFPHDLEVLLVGPGGQKALVMSDVGGSNDVNDIDLTFRDGAAALPGNLVTGTFAPIDVGPGDVLPAPAPAGPYTSALSTFNGTSPNGTWNVFVADDAAADIGSIDSISLLITTTTITTGDFVYASGQVDFPPGTTTKPVSITVNGDTTSESNETFFVNLFSPLNAIIGDGQGLGTIHADEGPQPPTGLFASSIIGNLLTLRFTPPLGGPAPTGYSLEGGLNPGETIASIPTGSTGPAYSIAAPNGSFFLRMRTLTAAGPSGPSNEIHVFINTTTAPSAPTNLLSVVNGNTLGLAWRNTFTGGVPTSIVLDVTGTLSGSVPIGVAESVSFPGVPPGTYTISLRAANVGGVSGASNAVTVTIPSACSGVPLTPTNFLAYKSGSQVSLLWDPAASGPAPTGFLLNVTGSFNGSIPLPGRSIGALAPPGTYNFTVQGTNPCGTGPATGVQTLTVP